MKIAIFTNNYLPNPYGVTNSIESFRKKLETWGHEVFIFAPRWKGYQDDNPKIFRYPAVTTNIKFKFPLPLTCSQKMEKRIAGMEIDLIHSQHPNLLGKVALRWAKKKKIPLVFTWHTLYDRYAHFFPFLPSHIVASWVIRNAVKYANQADLVIAPTESVIEILKQWKVRTPIKALSSGLEEDLFQDPEREKIRKIFGVQEDAILILLVSRLTEEKNVEFLFRSLESLLERNEKIHFLVVGGGYLLPRLKKRVLGKGLDRKVFFSGVVEKTELKNYLAAGDIFVNASLSETQGMNVSEAMYLGLPVVAVRATGISSLVKDGENGFLVGEDEKEFQDAVEKLVADEKLRRDMALASARIAKENFTDEVCARKMLAVYESLLKK